MIRPHRMQISDPPESAVAGVNGLTASITKVTFVGEAIAYEADVAGIRILIEAQTMSRGGRVGGR